MKTGTILAGSVKTARRLDAWYFLSPANAALTALDHAKSSGMSFVALGGKNGLAQRVHHPQRFARPLAAPGEPNLPYLRPYDVFNYYPEAADFVSAKRTPKLNDYRLSAGTILQTRSGRNLGPAVLVDTYLDGFVMSDDMIRIYIADARVRLFVLAYLNTGGGRKVLRRDKTGSVIDHLSEWQLANQQIPWPGESAVDEVVVLMKRGVELRESARLTLRTMIQTYESALPSLASSKPLKDGWSVGSGSITGRLDAAFYNPDVQRVRAALRDLWRIPLRKLRNRNEARGPLQDYLRRRSEWAAYSFRFADSANYANKPTVHGAEGIQINHLVRTRSRLDRLSG